MISNLLRKSPIRKFIPLRKFYQPGQIFWSKIICKGGIDENIEAFVVCVSSLRLKITIHLAKKAQIVVAWLDYSNYLAT